MTFTLNLFLTLLIISTVSITPFAQDGVVSKPAAKPASVPGTPARKKPRRRTLRQSPKPIVVLAPAPTAAVSPPVASPAAAQIGATGIELFNKKNYAAAEAAFRQALAAEPNNALHNYYLGATLLWQLKYAEGETYLRKAVALAPGNAVLRKDLANTLYYQQKYSQAEEELRTAVRLEPGVAAYQVQLGNLLYHWRKFSESEKAFIEAVRLEPDNAAYQKALATVQAAMKTAPASVSSEAVLHNNMGNALFEQRKYAEAEKEFREALRVDANNSEYINNLAKTLAARQKLAEAEAHAAVVTSRVDGSKQKHSWMVFAIENRTTGNIFYGLFLAGAWRQFVLEPQHKTLHTEVYQESVVISYDHKYEPGSQDKQYPVDVTKVTGHEPTDSDKRNAKAWAFILDKNGDIAFQPIP